MVIIMKIIVVVKRKRRNLFNFPILHILDGIGGYYPNEIIFGVFFQSHDNFTGKTVFQPQTFNVITIYYVKTTSVAPRIDFPVISLN